MTERSIFLKALDIDDPHQRAAYVEEACGGDAALRAEVEALLRSHAEAGNFLDRPIPEQAVKPASDPSSTIEGAPNVPATGTTPDLASGSGNAAAELAPTVVAAAEGDATDSRNDISDDDPLSFLEPPTKPGMLGRLAHYEIHEVLGRGGFGIVLRAFDEKLHRMVAIKAMTPAFAATSPPRKRFLREARSAAAVRHENVVNIYAVEERPIPYLVMEYIPGQTLQQRLDEVGPFDARQVVTIGKQLADGLAAAHQQGVIHRDIKPSNILLEKGGTERARITDFGLARTADDASLTQSGFVAGTPMYMAPEQARGEAIDTRADLFSLGSVLYVMSTGRPPFRAPTTLAVLKRVCEDTPRPIRDVIPEIPEWLCRIIGRLHAKNPGERYQTAREVSAVLGRCLARLQGPQTAPRRGSSARPSGLDLSTKASRIPRARSGSESRRSLRGLWFGGLLAAGVTAALVMTLRPFSDKDSPVDPVGSTSHVGPGPLPVSNSASPQSISNSPASAVPAKLKSIEPPGMAVAPFDEAHAARFQEEWARWLGVPVEYTNSLGMKFRLIPPGEFLMGSPREEIESALGQAGVEEVFGPLLRSRGPQHRVALTKGFYLGVHEVTQKDYRTVMGENPSYFSPEGDSEGRTAVIGLNTDDFPVESVSWDDAIEFLKKLSEREGRPTAYTRSGEEVILRLIDGYRLPTEAEWEYACRAGTTTPFWCGSSYRSLQAAAWEWGTAEHRSHRVGTLRGNPFGLHDVHGNVWEWVQGTWTENSYQAFAGTTARDPATLRSGPLDQHLFRGGSYNETSFCCDSAHRQVHGATYRFRHLGFRVALPVGAVRSERKREPASTTAIQAGTQEQQALPETVLPPLVGERPPVAIAPFDAKAAAQHQEAWARHLGVPVLYTNLVGMSFRLIPPGAYTMGSSPAEIERVLTTLAKEGEWLRASVESEGPQKEARIDAAFYLGTTELRVADFRRFVSETGYRTWAERTGQGGRRVVTNGMEDVLKGARYFWGCPEFAPSEDHPVVALAPEDVKAFCQWLSRRTSERYFLPREAQWEWACRGGTQTPWYTGDDGEAILRTEWLETWPDNVPQPTGLRAPNPFGLFDMLGNVHEWVDRQDSESEVQRGGAITGNRLVSRSATRWPLPPDAMETWESSGARVALSVDSVRLTLARRTPQAPR